MQLEIYKDYHELSVHAAEAILDTVKANPSAVLCLATGDTPRLTYSVMTARAIDEKVDFTGCTFIGLDEWVGVAPQIEGSCHQFLENHIFKPLNIASSQVYLFDGMSVNMADECRKADQLIIEKGGIDLMLVGVGLNGHIGFNEPGVSEQLNAHVIDLDEITRTVGQKYFAAATVITQGITLGLKQVVQSKKLIMMASGNKKAEIMQKALAEEITDQLPASIMRKHAYALAMIDEGAAELLDLQQLPQGISANK